MFVFILFVFNNIGNVVIIRMFFYVGGERRIDFYDGRFFNGNIDFI